MDRKCGMNDLDMQPNFNNDAHLEAPQNTRIKQNLILHFFTLYGPFMLEIK